jgi:hypothetical protein
MYHKSDNEFYCWLAGMIDGDGCFCMFPNYRKSKGFMTINFGITVTQKHTASFVVDYIAEQSKIGKVYISNNGKDEEKHTWQTLSIYESIEIAKKVLPYLVAKRNKAKVFLEQAEKYKVPPIRNKRPRGVKLRTNQEMKDYIRVALGLNYDRQTVRYRKTKGLDYWFGIIDKLYSQ